MTDVYRLVRAERAGEALSGEGARLYGGRWNVPGMAVVYASESRALAALETFVHLTLEARAMRFTLVTLSLPSRARLVKHTRDRPPRSLAASQEIAVRGSRRSCLLSHSSCRRCSCRRKRITF